MSFQKFWQSARRAVRLVRPTAIADSPRISADGITAALRSADLWLTAKVVEDYHPDGAAFLAPEERDRLSAAVERFRSVASGVDPRKPVDPPVREQALAAFREVVELMEFDRFDDPEAFRLGKIIEQKLAPVLPPHLDHLRFETGLDSTGDPALWVWVFVSDTGEYDEARFLERSNVIEDVVQPIVHEVAQNRWPFVRFRSTLDQPVVEGAPA